MTTWDYNSKDQVTNIVHKTSGGTTLASALYERAAGGEPTKVTREDGTYVALKYDAALRLTNEVYYSSGGVSQTTNSYGFDGSGNRVRLVKGGTTLTNSVSAGYRITAVKNGAATVESYTYDNGGRVIGMTRDGATRSFGYNSADQVTAATNGASWITYRHDANGRRTVSTNSAGTVRRLLVAPTPETDLESPHLIANASGTVQQGYVYLGDEPLLRYTTGGTATYYLEDGMGSVIGLAPSSSPSTANTTRLFYDGFGNARATNGPAPTIPTGAGGDFRFHGAWLEEGSGLYHMRAREYDPRMGRFTSRDPRNGVFQRAETLNPYVYAVNNPHVFADPSGEFTLVEINVAGAIDSSLQAFRSYAINRAKSYVMDQVVDAFSRMEIRSMSAIFPGMGDLMEVLTGSASSLTKGTTLEQHVLGRFCEVVNERAGNLTRYVYLYPGIDPETGNADSSGIHCPMTGVPHKADMVYPDFVIGEDAPTGKEINSWFIGDVKLSGNSLYNQYYLTRNDPNGKIRQLQGIVNYAARHAHTRMAVFVTFFSGDRGKLSAVGRLMQRDGMKKGVVVFVFAVSKNKGF